MSVDGAMRLAIKNYVTLFLMVACLTVPLHVGKAFLFRRVESVRELHSDIESFPPTRKVKDVGIAELEDARRASLVVTGIEIILLPVLAGATGRVLQRDAAGRLPGVADGWAHAWRLRLSLRFPAALVAGILTALATGLLVRQIGLIVIEPLRSTVAFAGTGLIEGVARAAGAPFLLVPLALPVAWAKGEDRVAPTI